MLELDSADYFIMIAIAIAYSTIGAEWSRAVIIAGVLAWAFVRGLGTGRRGS